MRRQPNAASKSRLMEISTNSGTAGYHARESGGLPQYDLEWEEEAKKLYAEDEFTAIDPHKNKFLAVIGEEGSWYHVITDYGIDGWVPKSECRSARLQPITSEDVSNGMYNASLHYYEGKNYVFEGYEESVDVSIIDNYVISRCFTLSAKSYGRSIVLQTDKRNRSITLSGKRFFKDNPLWWEPSVQYGDLTYEEVGKIVAMSDFNKLRSNIYVNIAGLDGLQRIYLGDESKVVVDPD